MERNAQVGMMARLYKQAKRVRVWLGGYDDSVKDMLDVMRNLKDLDWSKGHEYRTFNIFEDEYQRIGASHISLKQWLGLYSFLDRSWFRRSWVVQEMALAKEALLFCGLFMTTFDAFASLCHFLYNSAWYIQLANKAMADPNGKGSAAPTTIQVLEIPDPLFFVREL